MTDAMVAEGHLVLDDDGGLLTASGHDFLERIGIAPEALSRGRQSAGSFCRPCLDCSERRFHFAGKVARVLASHCIEQGWFRRACESRVLRITPKGQEALRLHFGLSALY